MKIVNDAAYAEYQRLLDQEKNFIFPHFPVPMF